MLIETKEETKYVKFSLSPEIQYLIHCMEIIFLKIPYNKFGKNEKSWDDYNIVFPCTFGSDRRKPVTDIFTLVGLMKIILILLKLYTQN
jgi:hypothetical protein